eukprot:25676-Eustigmatos_ZCMA.PRE.1
MKSILCAVKFSGYNITYTGQGRATTRPANRDVCQRACALRCEIMSVHRAATLNCLRPPTCSVNLQPGVDLLYEE